MGGRERKGIGENPSSNTMKKNEQSKKKEIKEERFGRRKEGRHLHRELGDRTEVRGRNSGEGRISENGERRSARERK